jgi:BirA family biotin operon repressor/biotin-[acetyl-CoA-carboxylase] ligase
VRVTPDSAARPPLDKSRLAANPHLIPDVTIEVLDEAASTNAVAVERARAGAPEGLVVIADHQSSGRGRLDRSWETPPGTAVTFSLLLRPTAPTRSWPWLPLLTGYAVDRALAARGFAAGVKWPNDVLIGERKVAGILVERIETPDGPAAVVGVGLNTSMTEDELPVPHATSLAIESGEEPDRVEVFFDVQASIREVYDAWQAGGDLNVMRVQESYTDACVTLGQDVRVDLPGGSVLEGRATGIDPTGQLVVATDDGERHIGAGDVVHVRALQ